MKRKNKTVILLSLILCILFVACVEDVLESNTVMFINNSDRSVLVYLGVASRELGGSLYPDTGIMAENGTRGPIVAHDQLGYHFNRLIETDTLCFFIFDTDTINAYSWGEIQEKYKVLTRYDIRMDLEGLRQLDFEIHYPPDEHMEGVNTYPPIE